MCRLCYCACVSVCAYSVYFRLLCSVESKCASARVVCVCEDKLCVRVVRVCVCECVYVCARAVT